MADHASQCAACDGSYPSGANYCPSCGRSISEGTRAPEERRGRMLHQQEALAALTAGGRLFLLPVDEAVSLVVETAAHALDVERVGVWLYTEDRDAIGCIDLFEKSRDAHERGAEIARDDHPSYFDALDQGRPVAADDAHTHPATMDFSQGYLTPLGIGSMLDAPIRVGGRLAGVVCHEHVGSARSWRIDEQTFAASLADLLSLVLAREERTHVERALQHSRERFDHAVRGSADGFWDWESNGNQMWWSPRFYELLGYQEGEMPASLDALRTLCHPEDLELVRRTANDHLERADPFDVECRLRTKDGRYRWFRVKAEGVWTPEGQPIRLAGSIQDVTDRIEALEALSYRVDLERLTVEISTNFINLPIGEIDEAIEWTLARVAQLAGAAVASMSRWAPESEELVFSHQWVAPGQESLIKPGTRLRGSEVPWFLATLLDRKPFQYWRPEGIPDEAIREKEILPVIGPTLAVAIVVDGEFRGHVALAAWNNPVNWQDETVILLELVANAIGNALSRRDAELTRQQLEDQLRQSQKMEAIGQLAGGIAHDFNNLLTVINSYSELVQEDLPAGSSAARDLGAVRDAGRRAASLTRQLMAFSRGQNLAPEVVDLNQIVDDLVDMLRRLLGDTIDIRTELEPQLDAVLVDPVQMEQVLINLAINARDAMPKGGRLTIATARGAASESDSEAGTIRLCVADTGSGIDSEDLPRIFDPFFTTKQQGQGTGLGLSTVFGIVSQSGGRVWAESEPGSGSAIQIELPVHSDR